MMTTRLFRVLLSTLLAVTHLTAGAQAAPELKFNFQYPTTARTTVKGRSSALTPEFADQSFDALGGLLAQAKSDNILPADWAKKPPTLWIYLPNQEVYLAHRHQLTAQARRQFAEIYPGVKLNVQIRPLNVESGFRTAFKRTMAAIKKQRAANAESPEAQRQLDEIEQSAQETYQETKKFYEMSAGASQTIKDSAATVRAFIVGGVRIAQTLPITAHLGGVPLATSLMLTVFDASAEYFIVKYTQRLQRLFAKNVIKTKWQGVNEALSITQNIILNMIVFNIGRSVIMQAIQHIAMPMDIPMPTGNTVVDIIKWTLLGSVIYVGFNKGYNRAIDKGWISAAQIDVLLQIPGVGDAVSPVLNTDDRLKFLRPYIFIPQWIFYAAVGIAGYVARRKSDRILAFDASLSKSTLEKEIYPEQPSSASLPYPIKDPKDYENVVSLVRLNENLEAARKKGRACQDDLKTSTDEDQKTAAGE